MSNNIIKRKSNQLIFIKSNQIIKISSNEKALTILSQKIAFFVQKLNIDINSTIKNDEEISKKISKNIFDKQRHNEINKIIEKSVEDAFQRYNISSKKDMNSNFKQFSDIIHFDKKNDSK